MCVHLQSHKTEALAGKLAAVYGVMSTPDFIKQKQSHSGHKSQVIQFCCLLGYDAVLELLLHQALRCCQPVVQRKTPAPQVCIQTGLELLSAIPFV